MKMLLMKARETSALTTPGTLGLAASIASLLFGFFIITFWLDVVMILFIFCLCEYLIYTSSFSQLWKESSKHIVAACVGLIIMVSGVPRLRYVWLLERAGVTEGNLVAKHDPGAFRGGVHLQIGGDQGAIFTQPSKEASAGVKLLYDMEIEVEKGSDGMIVSLPVRDIQGHLVAEISKNHWKVYPAFTSDKNFDESSLEVKDTGGHVVLQITLFDDKVQVAGEFYDQNGRGKRLSENRLRGSDLTPLDNTQERVQYANTLAPMFLYPSITHLGQHSSRTQGQLTDQ